MSELIHAVERRQNIRWQLLATVSTLALIGSACGVSSRAVAETDSDNPTVWVELGGQFENIKTEQETFAPPFSTIQPEIGPSTPGNVQIAPGSVQKPLDFSFGAEGEIAFEPADTDWVFSASVRFGRSSGEKHLHQKTTPVPVINTSKGDIFPAPSMGKFADAVARKTENYAILDFQAGKDVGLGMFGRDANSTLNIGIRFAQFSNGLNATLGSGPHPFRYKYLGTQKVPFPFHSPHTFLGKVQTTRNFHGLGPSISWDASAPFVGNPDTAEFTFDWGANAALLFGRQRANIQHQTTGFYYHRTSAGFLNQTLYQHAADHVRSHLVTVPNVGGFAGVSLKFLNAKVSLGYRANFFFGAIDGGIDTRKSEDVSFHGPFATVSIGLGGR